MRRTCVVFAMAVCLARGAMAQTANSFTELRRLATPGETVYVIDTTGVETKAQIFDVSDIALTLVVHGARRNFPERDVIHVERRPRDSVLNGVLIGLAAGGSVGYLQGRRLDSPSCPRTGIECGQGAMLGTIVGAAWGSFGGWLIDVLNRKHEVIYAAPPRR